jgi:hypothetical protein
MIFDEDLEKGDVRCVKDLVDRRSLIEEKFMKFCPPRIVDVGVERCENWLGGIEEFVEMACDPELQPVEAIPWF